MELFGIRIEGWLTILAIFLGPIVALSIQRWSERRREGRLRKLTVFKDLMATRAERVSPRHVNALNAIEIEFSSGRGSDKRVFDAWRLYLDHLNVKFDTEDSDASARWREKKDGFLVDLLYEMSIAVSLKFDKVALKNDFYSPVAHGDLEVDQFLLRKFLLDVTSGKRALPVGVVTDPKQPIRVTIVDQNQAGPRPFRPQLK